MFDARHRTCAQRRSLSGTVIPFSRWEGGPFAFASGVLHATPNDLPRLFKHDAFSPLCIKCPLRTLFVCVLFPQSLYTSLSVGPSPTTEGRVSYPKRVTDKLNISNLTDCTHLLSFIIPKTARALEPSLIIRALGRRLLRSAHLEYAHAGICATRAL